MSTFVIVGGGTATAAIDGLSAAGATPALRRETPAADLEVVASGAPASGRPLPVSPSGTPTPAVITRAVRELVGFDLVAVDAGLPVSPTVETRTLGTAPGADVREPPAVPGAAEIRESAAEVGATLDAEHLYLGETIPAGTTTALAVLRALGERATVSSSLPANPLERKQTVAETGLAAAGLDSGGAAGEPLTAVRAVGDPVLAATLGLLEGARDAGTPVTMAGGTQLAAVAALARHTGMADSLSLATTSFVAADDSAELTALAEDLSLELRVTDPGFERYGGDATEGYLAGEAKEGVGMGGALAVAEDAALDAATLCDRIDTVYDRLQTAGESPPTHV